MNRSSRSRRDRLARQADKSRESRTPPDRPKRRWIWATALAGTALAATIAVFMWPDAPAVPEIDLTGAEPLVVRHLEEARQKVAGDPTSADTWGELGILLHVYEFAADAQVCLQQAERLDPSDVRWPYYQALTLAVIDAEAALDCADRAAAMASGRSIVHLRRAKLLFDLGRLDESLAAVEKALEVDGQDPHAHLMMARVLYQKEEFSKGLPWARKAAQAMPRRHSVHEVLAKLYQRLGQPELAASEADIMDDYEAEQDDLDDPFIRDADRMRRDVNWLAYESEIHLQQGRYREAISLLQRIVDIEPETPDWHGRLARAYMWVQDLRGMERALQRGVGMHPREPELHFLHGVLRQTVGDDAGALQSFRAAIDLKADYVDAHRNAGLALLNLKRHDEAIEHFQAAIRLKPTFAEAYYGLGVCQRHLDDHEAAIQSFETVAELRADNADVLADLAELLLKQDRAAEALAHLEAAIRLAPDHDRVKQLLAAARAAAGGP